MHKLAWTYYRTKAFDRCVETMKTAISRASQGARNSCRYARKRLGIWPSFMTEKRPRGRGDRLFSSPWRATRSFIRACWSRLGKHYERNVEPLKATQVYESLLKTIRMTRPLSGCGSSLLTWTLRRGRYKEALGRLQGAKIITGGENETITAAQNLKAMVRRTATENHGLSGRRGIERGCRFQRTTTPHIWHFFSRRTIHATKHPKYRCIWPT